MSKISLFSHTRHSFAEAIFSALGKGRIHAGLIYEEFYRTGQITGSHGAFANAGALLQAILDLIDTSLPLELLQEKSDGCTGKILLRTPDRLEVETVLIPMQAGGTLCVSSQVGCRMGCAFCETGRMGLLRNLSAAEIISQVFAARHRLRFSIRNIVFMGMGEPFDNYDHVMQAVRILGDPEGFAFGRKHLTVSTSGCVDGIRKMIAEGDLAPNLAVSINAATDEERSRLMPVTKQFNLRELYEAMREYCSCTGRQILTAYVLLRGVNDTLDHADRLAEYLRGLHVKINLIPYNPQTRSRFAASEPEVMDAFAERLRKHGYRTLLRSTKGQKIMAACGQLGNLELRRARLA